MALQVTFVAGIGALPLAVADHAARQQAHFRVELVAGACAEEPRVGVVTIARFEHAAGLEATITVFSAAGDGRGFTQARGRIAVAAVHAVAGTAEAAGVFDTGGQTQMVGHLEGVAYAQGRLRRTAVDAVCQPVLVVHAAALHVGALDADDAHVVGLRAGRVIGPVQRRDQFIAGVGARLVGDRVVATHGQGVAASLLDILLALDEHLRLWQPRHDRGQPCAHGGEALGLGAGGGRCRAERGHVTGADTAAELAVVGGDLAVVKARTGA